MLRCKFDKGITVLQTSYFPNYGQFISMLCCLRYFSPIIDWLIFSLSTRVLLAVMSVEFTGGCSELAKHLDMEETQLEHQRKLANLLQLPCPPTRQSLIKEIVCYVCIFLFKSAQICPFSLAKIL